MFRLQRDFSISLFIIKKKILDFAKIGKERETGRKLSRVTGDLAAFSRCFCFFFFVVVVCVLFISIQDKRKNKKTIDH